MDMLITAQNIDISFSEAQQLCALYSPLKTNKDLYTCLTEVLSKRAKSPEFENMPRQIYNNLLFKHYPNETAIKAAFSNQYFFQSPKHVVIYELNAGDSRVDMCKISGTSIAYEIKTDLDNFNRLEKQLLDYTQLFDKVYVICSKNRSKDIIRLLPDNIGIFAYHQTSHYNYRFEEVKRPCNKNQLNPAAQLQMIPKTDLVKYLNQNLTERNDIENSILQHYSPTTINKIFKQCIRNKYEQRWRFIYQNHSSILDLDYQWFFKNRIDPELIYQ